MRKGPREGDPRSQIKRVEDAVDKVVRFIDKRPRIPDIVENVPAERRVCISGTTQALLAWQKRRKRPVKSEVVSVKIRQIDVSQDETLAIGKVERKVVASLVCDPLYRLEPVDPVAAEFDGVASRCEVLDQVGAVAGLDPENVRSLARNENIIAREAIKRGANLSSDKNVCEGVSKTARRARAAQNQILYESR